MVIRNNTRRWCWLVAWGAAAVIAAGAIPARAADPFADSFTSGNTKHPAHKTSPAKPASKPKPAVKPAAKPARPRPHPASRPARSTPAGGGDEFAPAEKSAPSEEAPEDRPRARHAAEPEEQTRSDEEQEDRPKARRVAPPRRPVKKHKRPADDEDGEGNDSDQDSEGDDDAQPYAPPSVSLPSVVPRLFSFLLGGTMMGRKFQFDTPLQRESSFPRIGYEAAIESYPLLLLDMVWLRSLGVAASFASEVIGQASVNGAATKTSVKQSRWNFELRYALPVGSSVVVTPSLGLASSSFTLETNMPMMASDCTGTATVVCIPDTQALLLQAGLHLRFAVTRAAAITVDGGYLQALQVKNKPLNQIGYEAGTSATGFDVAAGATYLLMDFLAVHAELPFMRLSYSFHNPPDTPYKSATETYYGLNVGLSVFTD